MGILKGLYRESVYGAIQVIQYLLIDEYFWNIMQNIETKEKSESLTGVKCMLSPPATKRIPENFCYPLLQKNFQINYLVLTLHKLEVMKNSHMNLLKNEKRVFQEIHENLIQNPIQIL